MSSMQQHRVLMGARRPVGLQQPRTLARVPTYVRDAHNMCICCRACCMHRAHLDVCVCCTQCTRNSVGTRMVLQPRDASSASSASWLEGSKSCPPRASVPVSSTKRLYMELACMPSTSANAAHLITAPRGTAFDVRETPSFLVYFVMSPACTTTHRLSSSIQCGQQATTLAPVCVGWLAPELR